MGECKEIAVNTEAFDSIQVLRRIGVCLFAQGQSVQCVEDVVYLVALIKLPS